MPPPVLRNRHFLFLDAALLALTPTLALGLRIDSFAGVGQWRWSLVFYTVLSLAVKLPSFYAFGLYQRFWRYASVDELYGIVVAVLAAGVATAVTFLGLQFWEIIPGLGLPRSLPLLDLMLTLFVVGGSRFAARAAQSVGQRGNSGGPEGRKRVLVAGAGDGGAMVVREMRSNVLGALMPVGFVDDDPQKQGMTIHGLPVLGSLQSLPRLVAHHGVEEVVIAMPSAPGKVVREVVALCEEAKVPSRTLPSLSEILSGRVGVSQLRNVDIEDLLRRERVEIDAAEVARMLVNARVLITGAGGSIGSELCRQIARAGAGRLTLLGHGENSLYLLENQLRRRFPELAFDVVVADIRDVPRLRAIFERIKPQVVFHASAHKHVPLMESNCEEAVTNNVAGTRNLVRLSEECGVERFVLISSDKAVNPANVMGATKRLAELVVQEAARRTGRRFVSVRFGNVLGSRGSVVPLFREQISWGGPVTVTHPDIRRYFMTIPEAVQLVLQAATLAASDSNGEVFVLDMGEPVAIVDLARDLIELSGLQVERDIDIVFTGLRPGEKLFEELFVEGEEYYRTRHQKILGARDGYGRAGGESDGASLDEQVDLLVRAARDGAEGEVRRLLREIVPNYTPAEGGR